MAASTVSQDPDAVFSRYMSLPTAGKVQAEYVWVGGKGDDYRCKSMTLAHAPASVSDLPQWNFDGSSTGQAPGHDSEVLLTPVKMVPDPFRGAPHILVLCECVNPVDGAPAIKNTRTAAKAIFDEDLEAQPWFGLEQEYTLFESDGRTVLGWPKGGFPGPQGPYYCGAGTGVSFGRKVMEAHYRACLYANLDISGVNAEVMPGQWEFQVGPCTGIDSGDQMVLARYIMQRVCEDFNVVVSFDPKPVPGDWNGAGCHVNYSTAAMRAEGGYDTIISAIQKLEPRHAEFIAAYGEGNERRLTGKHETASISDFTYGVANRGASIRIPRTTEKQGKGYFEDRRPASNMDPYAVTALLFKATHLE